MLIALTAVALLQGPAVLLRVNPPKGSVYSYDIKFRMEAPGKGSVDSLVPMVETYKGKKGKNYLWQVAFKEPTVTGTGELKVLEKTLKENYDIDPIIYERTTSNKPLAFHIDEHKFTVNWEKEGTSEIIFAEKPVKPGATWPGKIMAGSTPLDVTFKYMGPDKFGNLKTWKVESRPTGTGVKVIRPYEWQVDQRDGRVLHASGALEATVQGVALTMNFEIKQTSRKVAKS